MKIVTGRTGENHVTSSDDRHLNASIFGEKKYVLDTGEKLKGEYIASNTVRIYKGDIMFQGTHARIEDYEDVELNPGTSGLNRIDVICAQYKISAGVESVELFVYKGEQTSGTPVQPTPTYDSENILDGAEIADMELFKVEFKGLDIKSITCLTKTVNGLDFALKWLDNLDSTLKDLVGDFEISTKNIENQIKTVQTNLMNEIDKDRRDFASTVATINEDMQSLSQRVSALEQR